MVTIGDKIGDKIVVGWYECKTIQSLLLVLAQNVFELFGLCSIEVMYK